MLQVSLPHYEGYPSPREVVESRLRSYLIFGPTETGGGGDEHSGSTTGREVPTPGEEKPRVVHGSYFLADFYDDIKDEDSHHPQIFHANVASTELKEHVDKGKEIFLRMFPEDEFLPKPPEQEEVEVEMDLDGQEERADGDGGQEEQSIYQNGVWDG